MKTLIIGLLIFAAQSSFAQNKISSASCAKTPNQALAKDILNLIRTGDDEGKGNGTCELRKDIHWVKGAEEAFDTTTKRILLNPDDLVYVVGPVNEIEDQNGPTNVFKVNYKIENKSGKSVSGNLTFSRIFEQSYIDELGCAVIQNEPTVSFIQKDCILNEL